MGESAEKAIALECGEGESIGRVWRFCYKYLMCRDGGQGTTLVIQPLRS